MPLMPRAVTPWLTAFRAYSVKLLGPGDQVVGVAELALRVIGSLTDLDQLAAAQKVVSLIFPWVATCRRR